MFQPIVVNSKGNFSLLPAPLKLRLLVKSIALATDVRRTWAMNAPSPKP